MPASADILTRAIAIRQAQGLSVEVTDEFGTYIRHCRDHADRDAFMQRRANDGQAVRILLAQTEA